MIPVSLMQHWGRALRYLDDAAAYWIGDSMPLAQRAVEEARWRSDEPSDYCGRCGDSVGAGEETETGCGSCRRQPAIADRFVRLGPYTGELRNWIIHIKYQNRWTEMAAVLGSRLGEAVMESEAVNLQRAVIVPMPMPWQRRIYRGIDHARTIASAVGRELKAPVIQVLARSNGPPQMALSPSERARRGARGMRIRRRLGGWGLDDLDVVLVDDVRTTGASLKAAARLLRRLKVRRVVAAVLAVSDDAARRARAEQGEPRAQDWSLK